MLELSDSFQDYIVFCIKSKASLILASHYSSAELIEVLISLYSSIFSKNKPINNHPDILVVGEEGEHLSIDAVRSIQDFVSKVNFEFETQLIIIRELARINKDQANAMLKLIEESAQNDYTVIFLTNLPVSLSHHFIPATLETILSRCLLLYLPLTKTQVISSPDIHFEDSKFLLSRAAYREGLSTNIFVEELLKLKSKLNANNN